MMRWALRTMSSSVSISSLSSLDANRLPVSSRKQRRGRNGLPKCRSLTAYQGGKPHTAFPTCAFKDCKGRQPPTLAPRAEQEADAGAYPRRCG